MNLMQFLFVDVLVKTDCDLLVCICEQETRVNWRTPIAQPTRAALQYAHISDQLN